VKIAIMILKRCFNGDYFDGCGRYMQVKRHHENAVLCNLLIKIFILRVRYKIIAS